MVPDSVRTCCATVALASCAATRNTHVNFHRFRELLWLGATA
jgi:hypothetical protein